MKTVFKDAKLSGVSVLPSPRKAITPYIAVMSSMGRISDFLSGEGL